MEQTKRQRENSIDDDNKKKKLTISSNNISRKYVTHFEDLSNELIYEIFEYLDFSDIYEAFINLNIRFENFINYSKFPINVNLSLKSKINFEYYYKNILIHNKNRIKSIYLSNPLIIEHILSSSSFNILLLSIRLEKVTLYNIISIQLQQILSHLINSSNLFSLDIQCIDTIKDKKNFYHQIFILPHLKYCKLFCQYYVLHELIPVAINQYSPIQYLIIKHQLQLHEINSLLSYVPQLRRLSFDCKSQLFDIETFSSSIILNDLTHIYLKIDDFLFDKFRSIMKNLFHHIEILHISITSTNDGTYYDANRWKKFILTSLPHLKIFDIEITIHDDRNSSNNIHRYINRIDEFNSSFWIERKWFFQYGVYRGKDTIDHFLYSINPYRKKNVVLNGSTDEHISIDSQQCHIDSVNYVSVSDQIVLNNCRFYFPNVTKFKTSYQSFYKRHYSPPFSNCETFDSTNLNTIIPLEKLSTLDIDLSKCCLSNISEILHHTPNIDTLNITFMPNYNHQSIIFIRNQTSQLVSQTNKIKQMRIVSNQALETTRFLVMLCPRLKQLMLHPRFQISTIRRYEDSVEALLRFLLSKDNNNTRYLSSLLIESDRINSVKAFLESEKLDNISSIKIENDTNSIIYLWW